MVYGCDPAWWKHRRGLPEFRGLKVAWRGGQLEYGDVYGVEIAHGRTYSEEIELGGAELIIGGGGNSGFQALNLVLRFGATPILLVGFDMHDRGGVHWYGRNRWTGSNNPDASSFRRWIAAFDRAAPKIAAAGAVVLNAAPDSALQCFPKVTVHDFLDRLARFRPS